MNEINYTIVQKEGKQIQINGLRPDDIIEFVDSTGKRVVFRRSDNNFDLSILSEGIYFIRINSSGKQKVFKLLLN
jgi:hypothetical protein